MTEDQDIRLLDISALEPYIGSKGVEALRKFKIDNLGQLENCKKKDLLGIRGLSARNSDEIEKILPEAFGLNLALPLNVQNRNHAEQGEYLDFTLKRKLLRPIDNIPFSDNGTLSCLQSNKFDCIAELVSFSKQQLLKLPNMGDKKIGDIEESLSKYFGLELGIEIPKEVISEVVKQKPKPKFSWGEVGPVETTLASMIHKAAAYVKPGNPVSK